MVRNNGSGTCAQIAATHPRLLNVLDNRIHGPHQREGHKLDAAKTFPQAAQLRPALSLLAQNPAQGIVAAHNWGKYDFGSGPPVTDRLNQGPFPQYPPDAVIPTDDVVVTCTPSDDVVPNYGKGLVTYITADMGTDCRTMSPRPSRVWCTFVGAEALYPAYPISMDTGAPGMSYRGKMLIATVLPEVEAEDSGS